MFEESLEEKASVRNSKPKGKTAKKKIAKDEFSEKSISSLKKNEVKEDDEMEHSGFRNKLKEKAEGLKLDLTKNALPSLVVLNTPNLIGASSYPDPNLNSFRMNQQEEGQGKDQLSYYPGSSSLFSKY